MKLFVWDLHGTLERGTEQACLHISNEILKRNDYPVQFTQEEINLVFGRKWRDIFQTKIPNLKKSIYNELERQAYQQANESFEQQVGKYTKRNDHVEDLLSRIEAAGHEQILISNATTENVDLFIHTLELEIFFPPHKRYAVTNSNEENPKLHVLKNHIDNSKRIFTEIITIGDREGDIELVHVYGGVSYLYAHPGMPFKECRGDIIPDYRINDLRKVLKEI